MKLIVTPLENGKYKFSYEPRVKTVISNKKKCMVRVNDPHKTWWELFVILLAIYNSFSIPIEIAYEPEALKGASLYVLNTFIDFVFLADIIVQFRTTFYDLDTGDEIYDTKRIGMSYLKGRFTIDLLSTIPIDNIAMIFTQQKTPAL
jgi:hypothetical protein